LGPTGALKNWRKEVRGKEKEKGERKRKEEKKRYHPVGPRKTGFSHAGGRRKGRTVAANRKSDRGKGGEPPQRDNARTRKEHPDWSVRSFESTKQVHLGGRGSKGSKREGTLMAKEKEKNSGRGQKEGEWERYQTLISADLRRKPRDTSEGERKGGTGEKGIKTAAPCQKGKAGGPRGSA